MDPDGLPEDGPPPDAEGLDRPDEIEDQLDDLNDQFDDPVPERDTDTRLDGAADLAADSDDESLLSEVDEAQFADFDPKAVEVAPDFDTLKSIKITKRKRAEGEEPARKKTKEKRRDKPSRRAESEPFSGGDGVDGKRSRKSKAVGERPRRERVEIDEADLPEEERQTTSVRQSDGCCSQEIFWKESEEGRDCESPSWEVWASR